MDRPPQVLIRLFVSDIAAGLAQLAMKPETLDQCDVTDRKLLLALRAVGPESEAESVRFHGREVTKVGREVKHGRRVENPDSRKFKGWAIRRISSMRNFTPTLGFPQIFEKFSLAPPLNPLGRRADPGQTCPPPSPGTHTKYGTHRARSWPGGSLSRGQGRTRTAYGERPHPAVCGLCLYRNATRGLTTTPMRQGR